MSATSEHLERFVQRIGDLDHRIAESAQEPLPLLTLPITDGLTRLPTRKAISALVERELRCLESPVALIIFDVNDFGVVNNRYTLPGGDAVLVQLGTLLAATVGPGEFVGRFGGDQFLMVASNVDTHQSKDITERMAKAIEQARFAYRDEIIRISARFGFVVAAPGVRSDQDDTAGCSEVFDVASLVYRASNDMDQKRKCQRCSSPDDPR